MELFFLDGGEESWTLGQNHHKMEDDYNKAKTRAWNWAHSLSINQFDWPYYYDILEIQYAQIEYSSQFSVDITYIYVVPILYSAYLYTYVQCGMKQI